MVLMRDLRIVDSTVPICGIKRVVRGFHDVAARVAYKPFLLTLYESLWALQSYFEGGLETLKTGE